MESANLHTRGKTFSRFHSLFHKENQKKETLCTPELSPDAQGVFCYDVSCSNCR